MPTFKLFSYPGPIVTAIALNLGSPFCMFPSFKAYSITLGKFSKCYSLATSG